MVVNFIGHLTYTTNIVESLSIGDYVRFDNKNYVIKRKLYNLENNEITFVVVSTDELSNIVDVDTHTVVKYLVDQGKKLEAVKYLKEHTSMGLKEAKDYVDSII